jgi:hypothetical protein
MRCPKCGYISFDHIDTCLRCNKDISKATAVEGTTYNVAPPAFLKFTKRDHEAEEKNEISFDADDDDFGVVDPDLDVLVDNNDEDDEDGGIAFGDDLDGFDAFGEEDSFETPADLDDDEDSGLDLGQFEDAFEDEEEGRDDDFNIDIPDELSDISDLSAPAEEETKAAIASAVEEEQDEFGDFNLDLDMDDLNDDFSLGADVDEDTEVLEEDALADLSLDDLGLTETEAEIKDEPEIVKSSQKTKKDETNMDGDLDFDLDLGGISLDDED